MTAPVWLVGSHHNFYKGSLFSTLDRMPEAKERKWKPLLPEYLRRSFVSCSGKTVDSQWNAVYVSALRALQQLDGFVSAVSFQVLEDKKDCIQLTKRDWGQIYLANSNKCVVSFSHDTRYENKPFYGLLEWLEDPQFDNNNVTPEQLHQYSNVEIWRKFFIGRIESVIRENQLRIATLEGEIKCLSADVSDLKSALNPLVKN